MIRPNFCPAITPNRQNLKQIPWQGWPDRYFLVLEAVSMILTKFTISQHCATSHFNIQQTPSKI